MRNASYFLSIYPRGQTSTPWHTLYQPLLLLKRSCTLAPAALATSAVLSVQLSATTKYHTNRLGNLNLLSFLRVLLLQPLFIMSTQQWRMNFLGV